LAGLKKRQRKDKTLALVYVEALECDSTAQLSQAIIDRQPTGIGRNVTGFKTDKFYSVL